MALTKHKSANVSDVSADRAKRARATRDRADKDRAKKDRAENDHSVKGRFFNDQRVIRTRKQLDTAFVELLHRRAYGNIRVSDITKKAGVGRATFYAHYSSKDALLSSQFQRIVAPMLITRRDGPCPLDASVLFAHVKSAPHIYRSLTGPSAGDGPRILRDCFELRVRRALELRKENFQPGGLSFDTQRAIVTRFVASSLLTVIDCWVESRECDSPQEVQAIFSRLIGEGLAVLVSPT